MVFGPGGSTGRPRACSFLEAWRALLCGEVSFGRRIVPEAGALFGRWMTRNIIFRERYNRIVYAVCIAVDRGLSAAGLIRRNVLRKPETSDGSRICDLRG